MLNLEECYHHDQQAAATSGRDSLAQILAGASKDDLAFDPVSEGGVDRSLHPRWCSRPLTRTELNGGCLEVAGRGGSFVMDGPPEIGKSHQTIANVVPSRVEVRPARAFGVSRLRAEFAAVLVLATGVSCCFRDRSDVGQIPQPRGKFDSTHVDRPTSFAPNA
jgi:hypothetical protein